MSPTTTRSPSKLRKSLSVDSFVRLGHPDEPSTTSAPGTTAARSTTSPNDRPPSPSRVRTYSVSTADTSSRESSLPRTLSEPTNPPRSYKSRDRPRRTSEEPLPSNVPPTRPRPSPLNDLARTGPLPGPSQYNPFRKSSTSRTRSGSIGMNNPTGGVAMAINTQTSVRSCTHLRRLAVTSSLTLRYQVNPWSLSPLLAVLDAGRAALSRKVARHTRCPSPQSTCL